MQQLHRCRHKIATVLVFVALLSEERAFGFQQGAASKRGTLEAPHRDPLQTPAGSKRQGDVSFYVRDVRADSRQSRIDASDIRTDFREIRTVIEQRQCPQALSLADRTFRNDERERMEQARFYRGNGNVREAERSGSGSNRESSRRQVATRLARSVEDISSIRNVQQQQHQQSRSRHEDSAKRDMRHAERSSGSNRSSSELKESKDRRVRDLDMAQRSTGQSRNDIRGIERFYRGYQTRRNRLPITGPDATVRKSFRFEQQESDRSRTTDTDLPSNQRSLDHQRALKENRNFIKESRRSSGAEQMRRDRLHTEDTFQRTNQGTISRRVMTENRASFKETDPFSRTTRDNRQVSKASVATATERRDANRDTRLISSVFIRRNRDLRERSSRAGQTSRNGQRGAAAATSREQPDTSRNQRLSDEKNTPLNRRVLQEAQDFTKEAERSSRTDQTRRNGELAANTRNRQDIRRERSIDELTTKRRIATEIRDVSRSQDPQRVTRSSDRTTELLQIHSGNAERKDISLFRDIDSSPDSWNLFLAKPPTFITDGLGNNMLQTVLVMALVGQLLVTANTKGGLSLTNTWHRFFTKEKVH